METCFEGPHRWCHRVGEAMCSLAYAPIDSLTDTSKWIQNEHNCCLIISWVFVVIIQLVLCNFFLFICCPLLDMAVLTSSPIYWVVPYLCCICTYFVCFIMNILVLSDKSINTRHLQNSNKPEFHSEIKIFVTFDNSFLMFVRDDSHYTDRTVSVTDLTGYISSWSGFQNFQAKNGDEAALNLLQNFQNRCVTNLRCKTWNP